LFRNGETGSSIAAISAARSYPILREIDERLKTEKGKPHKVAIVAFMRKMLTVLNELLADPQCSLA
jgi:transposase